MDGFAVTLLSMLVISGASATVKVHGTSDIGSWTVGDCILAQFAMTFQVHPNATNGNETVVVEIPADAKVDDNQDNCNGKSEGKLEQYLTLSWKDTAHNDTSIDLERNLTIRFVLRPNDTFYGVDRVYATFEWGKYEEEGDDNKTVTRTSVINLDTQTKKNIAFHTPLDRSYLCNDIGTVHLNASLMYDLPNFPPAGIKLTDATMRAEHVRFDAFRTKDTKPVEDYRTPVDCEYKPNDVVPIAVGVALAGLVIAVLVAYMVGRRRHRQRGYESV